VPITACTKVLNIHELLPNMWLSAEWSVLINGVLYHFIQSLILISKMVNG